MGKRNHARPLLSRTERIGERNSSNRIDFTLEDDVDQFVSSRHKKLVTAAGVLSDSDADSDAGEPELNEQEILPLDLSDSDDEGNEDSSKKDADADEDDEDDEDDDDDDDDDSMEKKRDWGGRRRMWYGGDTHEYEVMEDEERNEALKDEEEEAVRLQKEAISSLSVEDFGQGEDEDEEDVDESDGLNIDTSDEVITSLTNKRDEKLKKQSLRLGRDEITMLINEAAQCEREIVVCQLKMSEKNRRGKEKAALLFHLYSAFVCNVAFFLSLHEDPEAVNVDIRTHPVVPRIVRIRTMLSHALKRADDISVVDGFNNTEIISLSDTEGDTDGEDEEEDSDDRVRIDDHLNGQLAKKRKSDNATPKSKRGTGKRNFPKIQNEDQQNNDDEDIVDRLFSNVDAGDDDPGADPDVTQDRKRRKLNRLVNEMERERKNKETRRMASADLERVRHEQKRKRRTDFEPSREREVDDADADEMEGKELPFAGQSSILDDDDGFDDLDMKMDMDMDDMDMGMLYGDDGADEGDGDGGDDEDDDELKHLASVQKERKKAKNQARKARRLKEAAKPHVYRFDDSIDADEKRKASTQVVKNRGLTRYRPRDKKTPRARNRAAYAKALKKRKSITREYQGKPGGGYSGETTGINISSRRGSNLSSV